MAKDSSPPKGGKGAPAAPAAPAPATPAPAPPPPKPAEEYDDITVSADDGTVDPGTPDEKKYILTVAVFKVKGTTTVSKPNAGFSWSCDGQSGTHRTPNEPDFPATIPFNVKGHDKKVIFRVSLGNGKSKSIPLSGPTAPSTSTHAGPDPGTLVAGFSKWRKRH